MDASAWRWTWRSKLSRRYAHKSGSRSAASELAALIAEDPETFRALKAPVRRVCAAPVPVPYSPSLERAALPNREDIKAAIYEVLKESLRPR